MKTNKVILFIGIPIVVNLLLIGLYFSGNQSAQQLIAPSIEWLSADSWREFGLLEQLQNVCLLIIVMIFAVAMFEKRATIERILFISGFSIMLFLLLEETDYGVHFYDFLMGHSSEAGVRNWHNQETYGKQNVRYLKQLIDFISVIWFIILPIFSYKITNSTLKSIIPSRWFIIGFLLSVVLSRFAHFLQDMDLAVINGVAGNLDSNISEFRELTTYYLYILYALQLYKNKLNFIK